MNVEHIIVGNSIESLLKSYSEDKKIILTDFEAPYFEEEFAEPLTIEGQEYKKLSDAWSMLRFIVSMRGLVVNPENLFSLRLNKDSIVFNRRRVTFKKCHLFPNEKTKCHLDIKKVVNQDVYKVIDVMRLPFCNVQYLNTATIDNCFIDKVRFYGKKRIVCTSVLTRKQLNQFDYSDTMSRIYVEKYLINDDRVVRPLISPTRGKRNPKPVVLERIVVPLEETIYESTKEVKFYDSRSRNNIIKAYSRNNTSC